MIYSLGYSQVESLNLVSRFLLFECFKPVAFMIKSEGYGNPVTRIKRWLESTSRTAHFINDYFLILQTISIFNESLINLNQFWPKPIECLRYRPTYRPYKMQKPLQSTKIWKYIQFYFLLHFVSLINTRKRISNESMIRSRSGIHETDKDQSLFNNWDKIEKFLKFWTVWSVDPFSRLWAILINKFIRWLNSNVLI